MAITIMTVFTKVVRDMKVYGLRVKYVTIDVVEIVNTVGVQVNDRN